MPVFAASAEGAQVTDVDGNLFESGDLLRRSESIGARIEAHARRWAESCPLIGDIRRRGAMIGIELVKDRVTREPAKQETQAIIASAAGKGSS